MVIVASDLERNRSRDIHLKIISYFFAQIIVTRRAPATFITLFSGRRGRSLDCLLEHQGVVEPLGHQLHFLAVGGSIMIN